jgi:hypothetical protein
MVIETGTQNVAHNQQSIDKVSMKVGQLIIKCQVLVPNHVRTQQ